MAPLPTPVSVRACRRGEAPGEQAGRAFSTMERARSPAATHTCVLNLSTLGGASRNFPEVPQGRGRQGWNPRLNPEPSQGSDVLPTGPSNSTQTLWSHLQHPPHAGTYQSSRSAKVTARQPQEQAQPGATRLDLVTPQPWPRGSVTARCGAGGGMWAAPQ